MRTILFILTLIGLIGCKVTNNYYSIYPAKVERVEAYEYPSVDPGLFPPIPRGFTVPGYDNKICTDTTLRIRFN